MRTAEEVVSAGDLQNSAAELLAEYGEDGHSNNMKSVPFTDVPNCPGAIPWRITPLPFVVGEYRVYQVSNFFKELLANKERPGITLISTGIRRDVANSDKTLLQIGLKVRSLREPNPIDLSAWVVMPSSWSKKMYLASLHHVLCQDRYFKLKEFSENSDCLTINNVHTYFTLDHSTLQHRIWDSLLLVDRCSSSSRIRPCLCQYGCACR